MFRRSSHRYGQSGQPETPYHKAGQLWDERIGSARVQARNWRLMALTNGLLAIGLATAVVWQNARSTVIPYVVEVDTVGDVRALGPALDGYRPTDAQIAHQLARFITNVRGLSLDPVVVRKNWLEAYDYTTDRAARTLNAYAKERDPFARIGEETVAVEVASVTRASDDSFQVKWREEIFVNGTLARTERYNAILSVVLRPPSSEDQLRKNPLGIYVSALNWSRETI